MDWQEITVSLTRAAGDLVTVELQEIGIGGAVLRDPALLRRYKEKGGWEYSDLTVEPREESEVLLTVYIPGERDPAPVLARIHTTLTSLADGGLNPGSGEITMAVVREEDWANTWKAFYKPMAVGDRLFIRPSWEAGPAPAGRHLIELDPGMAFGTGTHPTTVLCLTALERYLRGGEIVCDIGTGSGILAIAAVKLGARAVTAVDIDPVAVRTARENIRGNGVETQVEVRLGDIGVLTGSGPVALVVANIIADIIISIAPQVRELLVPGGIFVASGIIQERYSEVSIRLTQTGFTIREVVPEGEWILITAVRE